MTRYDLIVIGSGPGGYPAAVEAAAHGKNVAIIERDLPGGTCLNRGCIPTKAMCRSAEVAMTVADAAEFGILTNGPKVNYATVTARRDNIVQALREGVAGLLSRVRVIMGEARFVGEREIEVAGEQLTADTIIIATGARPWRLPIEGADLAMTSDELLEMQELPESLAVIGGGVIGLEFASVYAALGVKVTVLEFLPEILPPFDAEVAKRLRTTLKRRGIDILVGAQVTAIRPGHEVEYTLKGKQQALTAEKVLMAVGRRAVIPEGFMGDVERGCIKVNPRTMETSIEGVYAVGDVNGICQLAHAATAQGELVVGKPINLDVIPAAVFTIPEMAMVGITEAQAKELGADYRVGKATFRANGKAMAMGETDGMVKVLIDNTADTILGAFIMGPHAADIIHELALAMAAGLTVSQITGTIHAHPTLTEAILPALC